MSRLKAFCDEATLFRDHRLIFGICFGIVLFVDTNATLVVHHRTVLGLAFGVGQLHPYLWLLHEATWNENAWNVRKHGNASEREKGIELMVREDTDRECISFAVDDIKIIALGE